MNRRRLKRSVRASRSARRRRKRRREEMRRGRSLHRAFHGYQSSRVRRLPHKRLKAPVVVRLGDLVGLIYRSDKWQRGRPRTFIHFMKKRPLLVSNARGTQLYIAGGSYRITARGIEG